MFWHIFKYQLKCRFRDKLSIFWTLLFPIVLATIFNLAFSNILTGEEFEKVNIALVNSSKISESFSTAIEDSDLFIIENTDKNSAEEMLSKGEISGYITFDDNIEITVAKSGINESIIKTFVDSYSQKYSTISNVVAINPSIMNDDFMSNLALYNNYTKDKELNSSTNLVVIYFYTLLAMTCILASTPGCTDVINIQGNQSQRAARINIAPVNKIKTFLAAISATLLFYFSTVLIVILYISQVLKIDFGNSIGYVILLCFVGCFNGITLGAMVSALINKKASIKEGILLAFTMVCSFLSGMMAVQIKYSIQDKFPLLSYINPVNLITDGFYSLYYYSTYDRYFLNLGLLTLYGIIFSIVTYLILRRQKYASI